MKQSCKSSSSDFVTNKIHRYFHITEQLLQILQNMYVGITAWKLCELFETTINSVKVL